MTDHHVLQSKHDADIEDVRLDFGVLLQRNREEWRRELKDKLGGFRSEMRVLILATIIVLKFQLPSSLTIGAVGLVVGKTAWGLIFRH